MYILHVASEFAPLAKVGGLGDVVHGLAREQAAMGNEVEVILPKYDTIKYKNLQNFEIEFKDLFSFEDAHRFHNSVLSGFIDEIKVHLVEAHHPHYYFNRGHIYGEPDDIERFLYFSRTVGEYLHQKKRRPDVIHLHDWPTASLAPILRHIYSHLGFSFGSIVITIHNIEHQGRCHPANLTRIGLRGEDFRTEDKMQDPHDPSIINILKGGLVYSDAITTVSPTYAKEIQTSTSGFGLDPLIRKYQSQIHGILNGIELETWNPALDPYISHPYPNNPTFIATIKNGKETNKKELFQKLGMKLTDGPLIACISRLAKQKGPKLILQAIHLALKQNASFILLGSAIDKEFEAEFQELKETYKDHPNFYMKLTYDEAFSHALYAAADAIFIPSLFEPCGLTQMIGMRYGTIPIARNTGGLSDTVFDIDNQKIPLNLRNGFIFEHPDSASVDRAIKRAITCYRQDENRWRLLIQNCMAADHGWKKSAKAYEYVYFESLKKGQSSRAA
jgi:starch synthase